MRIAITGGRGLLGQALIAALRPEHEVVITEGDLRDETVARRLLEGANALVHLAPIAPELPAGAADQDVLDAASRGTYVLLHAALAAGVRRVVLGSTLALFARYPSSWAVSESWRPLPDVTDAAQLAAHLAERSAQQFAHFEPLEVIALRFGVATDGEAAGKRRDERWLHVDDAVQAITKALSVPLRSRSDGGDRRLAHGWRVYHIPGAGNTRVPLAQAARDLGYTPLYDLSPAEPPPATDAERAGDLGVLEPRWRIPSRPIRRVVIFGAGGPLAAATTRVLAPSYVLRLTDLRPIAEIAAEGKPQSLGAPLPEALPPPHETMEVDVADFGQVLRACDGMDAIINCTVVRPHPVNAFLVNCIGAYNVMRAATIRRIRRVVHTGPLQVSSEQPAGYGWDFDVPDDAPARPGGWLYGHSKFLGQELVRLFAEAYDLEVPALYYSSFVDPETAPLQIGGVHPMSISWEDAGHAMRRALEVPTLPSPFAIFHILADLPQGRYSSVKAQRLLGWRPRDTLAHLWARRA